MKLHEWAKEQGITLVMAKEITGLTHHLKEVPEKFLIKEETEDTAETIVIEAEPEPKVESKLPDGVTPEIIWQSLRGLANKSPYWEFREMAKAPSNYKGIM